MLANIISNGIPFLRQVSFGLSDLLLSKFLYLWTGKYDDGDLDNDLGEDVITVNLPPGVISYGRLYNQYTIADIRGIAPTGWRVPSGDDLDDIRISLGGDAHVTGAAVRSTRTSPDLHPRWNLPNINANNSTGFSGLPGGFRHHEDPDSITFSALGTDMWLWSSTLDDSISAMGVFVNTDDGRWIQTSFHRRMGFAIRMVRESLDGWSEGETVTDLDGNVYDTVRIGDLVWTVQSWVCTKYANGDNIPNVTNTTEWVSLETGAYCNYDNDPNNAIVAEEMWTSRYIPETTLATFAVPATQAYIDADTDSFWDDDVTFADLIASETERTFVKYTDFEPYKIYAIGILKAGESITEADEEELTRFFKLWFLYFGDPPREYGYMKDNRILPNEGEEIITLTASLSKDTDSYMDSEELLPDGDNPIVTFTGGGGTAPYTFTYNIDGGEDLTVTTTSGDSVGVEFPVTAIDSYVFTVTRVSDATANYTVVNDTETVVIYDYPTGTITSVVTQAVQNTASPSIIFTGSGGPRAYTFRYRINGGSLQTIQTTIAFDTIHYPVPTGTITTYTFVLEDVMSGLGARRAQTGSVSMEIIPA